MDEQKGGWGRLYREDLRVLHDKGLSSSCAAVYGALVSFCGSRAECWPSIREIMELACIHDRETCIKRIDALVEAGIITKTKTYSTDGGQSTNRYTLLLRNTPSTETPDTPSEETPDSPNGEGNNPRGASSSVSGTDIPTTPGGQSRTRKEQIKNNRKEQDLEREMQEKKSPRKSRTIKVSPEFWRMKGNTSLALRDADAVSVLADYSTQELADCTELIRGYLNSGKRRARGRANTSLTAGAPVILKLLEAGYTMDDFRECQSRLESGVWQWTDLPQIVREVCG